MYVCIYGIFLSMYVQISLNFPTNCGPVLRQMPVWKKIEAVLARLFSSKVISKFFYLLSLVLNS